MIEESQFELSQEFQSNKRRPIMLFIAGASFFVFSLVLFFTHYASPPKDFPEDSTVIIESGMSVADIVETFEQQRYVRSSSLLLSYLRFFYDTDNIKAGVYYFSEPLTTREVAYNIAEIGPNDPLISVTFPEGSTVKQIAEIAEKKLPNFETETFLSFANDYEGYLFPETYFVPENFTAEQLFDLLVEASETELKTLQPAIEEHPLSEIEIITLASIIEREANSAESMQTVSSVLQNRLAINMPLQADASIEYVLDKPLSELLPEDLKIDSPYNTYLNKGLPPTPIGNPGLTAIKAVLEPADTDYFYYITGNDGEFYFAETFDEHNRNIARYLR